MATVELLVRSRKTEYDYGEQLRLSYQVRNSSKRPLFIVNDRVYKQKTADNKLHILVGELQLPEFPDYFQYRVPSTVKLSPGQTTRKQLAIGMPLTDSVIGSDGLVHTNEIFLAGVVEITLTLGYGLREFAPRGSDPRGEFLHWQKLVRSKAITVRIEDPDHDPVSHTRPRLAPLPRPTEIR